MAQVCFRNDVYRIRWHILLGQLTFTPSVNLFFKRAYAAIQWGQRSDFHTLCVRIAKALVRLRGCAGSLEPSLFAYVISTVFTWAGSLMKTFKPTVQQGDEAVDVDNETTNKIILRKEKGSDVWLYCTEDSDEIMKHQFNGIIIMVPITFKAMMMLQFVTDQKQEGTKC